MNRHLLRVVALWVLVSAASGSVLADGLPSQQTPGRAIDGQVVTLLRAGVDTPLPRAVYGDLGPEATGALIRAFHDRTLPRYVRLRALSALQPIRDPRVAAFFRELLAQSRRAQPKRKPDELHPARSEPVLRRALMGLLAQGAQIELDEVAPCLQHRSAHIRTAAVRLIGRHPTKRARQALARRLAGEPSARVRQAIEKALKDPPAPR